MKLTPDQIIARHGLLVQAGAAPLLARIASLEAEIQALRGGLLIVHGEVSRLVGAV